MGVISVKKVKLGGKNWNLLKKIGFGCHAESYKIENRKICNGSCFRAPHQKQENLTAIFGTYAIVWLYK
jgi:hypothetical protein